MSQPQHSQHPTVINAPLNFRTSDTLITTKVPHYPTKVNTGTLIIPGWTRPNANGMNSNINQADFNGPDFKARPLKQWRRQLRVYNDNHKGPSNNSRTARIADLDRPGLTVYHYEPDCSCVDHEGGNSYIIANNKFSYETKGDQYSEPYNDVKIQNNGFIQVPATSFSYSDGSIEDSNSPTVTGIAIQNKSVGYGASSFNLWYPAWASDVPNTISYAEYRLRFSNGVISKLTIESDAGGNQGLTNPDILFALTNIPLNGVTAILQGKNIESNSTNHNWYDVDIPSQEIAHNQTTVKFSGSTGIFKTTLLFQETNPYKVLTGVYNTNCINCSPENNIIKGAIAYNSQAYYADSFAKQQSRCQTYEQNISTNRTDTSIYFGADGEPLWPNNLPTGSQVVQPVEYTPVRLYDKPCVSQTIYKPNNVAFGKQGAVSGSTRLRKLVADTVMINGSSFYSAAAAAAANMGHYQGTNVAGNYYVKMKPIHNSCVGGKPCVPVITSSELSSNTVTLEWIDGNDCEYNSRMCKVSYYILTYYPASDTNNINQLLIYSDDTYKYTVNNLLFGTLYNFFMAASNGNGTSKNSHLFTVTTLLYTHLSLSSIRNKIYGDKPFQLPTPSSNRIGDFIYSSDNPNVATVTPTGLVTIVGAGSANINIVQKAITKYAEGLISSILTVIKAVTTIAEFTIPDKTYGDPPFQLPTPSSNRSGAFIYSSYNKNVATVTPTGLVTIVGAGNTIISISQESTNNYFEGSVSINLNITYPKQVNNITPFTIPVQRYGNQPYQLSTPVSSSTGNFVYSSGNTNVATVSSSGLITIVNSGVTIITITQETTATYLEGSVSATFTVLEGTTIITPFNIPDKTYGDQPFQLPAPSSNRSGAFIYSSSNTNVATVTPSGLVTIVGAGNTTISISQPPIINYIEGYFSTNFNILKAVTTITTSTPFNIPDKIYGDQPFQLPTPLSNRTGNFVYSSSNTGVATVSSSGLVTIIDAGSTVITIRQDATNNYLDGSIIASFNVNKALITPTLSNFNIPSVTVAQSNINIIINPPTSNSNGVFTYSVTNQQQAYGGGNFVSIVGNVITVGSPGTATIVATQAPSGIYGTGTISSTLYVASLYGT